MKTVFFLNIDGILVNAAHITRADWYEGRRLDNEDDYEFRPCLYIYLLGENDSTRFDDSPESRAAYEYLKSLAVNPLDFVEKEESHD